MINWKLRKKFCSCVLPILFLFVACDAEQEQTVSFNYLTGNTSLRYLKLSWNNLSADLEITRPDRNNSANQICIPLTPPDSSEYKLKYFHCIEGDCSPDERYNDNLPGGILIRNGKIEIVFPQNFAAVDSIKSICESSKSSFTQLKPVLQNGKNVAIDARTKLQRRAIVSFKDGSIGIIETEKHNTPHGFAEDLKKFDVVNAVMTITGVYDEGWYYYATVPVAMGRLKSRTRDQENWLVLKLNN